MNDLNAITGALPQIGVAAAVSGANNKPSTTVATTSTSEAKHGKNTTALMKYIGKHNPAFLTLCKLREEGWENKEADKHFEVKRNTADYPTDNDKIGFFKMTQRVGAELNRRTGCMNIHDQPVRKNNLILEFPAILDLGIAPGGFSATAMQANPTAILRAVTLDPKEGGHDVMLYQRDYNNDVHIEFMDRTMLAGEMGLGMNEVPVGHPEAKKLNHDLIFPEIDEFDLVFCGGTPTRNHRQHQAPYREFVEGLRLSVSQLVIALNHIREGGTIVMLMHRPETWITCQSMYMLSKFSEIRPFKPRAAHKTKSSFYLIATDVKPRSIEAQDAVRRWKATWKHLTINTHGLHDVTIAELEDTELAGETVEEVLRNFGAQLVNKSRTIWLEQAEALKNAPWLRKGQKAAGGGRAEGSGGNKAQV